MNNNEIALNIIKKSKKSLTAYEILDKFQKIKKVQPMTVYRSLNHLINEGVIHKANHNKSYLLCNHFNKEIVVQTEKVINGVHIKSLDNNND